MAYNERPLRKDIIMETKHIVIAAGITIVILAYEHHKLQRTVNALDHLADIVDTVCRVIDNDFQKDVDEAFKGIVEGLE